MSPQPSLLPTPRRSRVAAAKPGQTAGGTLATDKVAEEAAAVPGAAGPGSRCFYRRSLGTFDFIQPVLNSIHLVHATKGPAHPQAQACDYRVIFIQRGIYRCRLNDQPLDLRPHDLLVVKRDDKHEEAAGTGLEYLAVNFDVARGIHAPSADILFAAEIEPAQQVLSGPNEEIGLLLGRMREEARHRDPFAAHIQNGLLLQVVCAIARALPPERLSPLFLQRPAVQGFSERLYRVFEQHLGENFSAATIAHKMAVSVRTLTKRCQAVFGWPPARAFKQYKMEYAARALRQSDLSIKEISHRLGFQNQYHFSRVFRQCVGVPPSHYRHTAEGTPLAT